MQGLLGLLLVSGAAVQALETAATKPSLSLVSKTGRFGRGQEAGDSDTSDDDEPIPTVSHDKVKGNGYAPGSPLYNKQEQLKSGGARLSDEEAKKNACLHNIAMHLQPLLAVFCDLHNADGSEGNESLTEVI